MPVEFKDYNPNDSPRKQAKDITSGKVKPHFIGKKSKEVQKQELISHIQNYQETFNNQETKAWKSRLAELMVKLEE